MSATTSVPLDLLVEEEFLVMILLRLESLGSLPRSPSLLDAPNDPVPSLLPIISYPLFIVGSLCDHADCQRGNPSDILLTIKDDILSEKLLNVNLLIANIEALKDNPAPSSDVMTKSSSTSLNLFLEETNTFDNSSPESETFCFDLEKISSGSTTTRSDYSLPDYKAFYSDGDHIKEKSSGSTTTHADFS
ncbi:hypothetical protein Tco_0560981 [Tanacetum coccineum]